MLKELEIGKNGENLVKSLFNSLDFESELNQEYEKRYDFDLWVKIGKKKFTFECKNDLYSIKSGNVAIEYRNSKKNADSGIYSTKADFWTHLLPNKKGETEIHLISVSNLINYVETVSPFRIIKSGGNDNADIFLYKKYNILEEFKRIDNIIDKDEMNAIIMETLNARL